MRVIKKILIFIFFLILIYGLGRLYYALTGGFTESNIKAELTYNSKWETHPLSDNEKNEIRNILNQPFSYLGKGCQAYVFKSADENYVIKFFKYQRFRPQSWIEPFTFIPPVKAYQLGKIIEKKEKLDKVFTSWKIAFENLKKETGTIYVHLNKTDEWHQILTLRDKLGLQHEVDLDQTEFLLQKRATMLCPALHQLVAKGEEDQAQLLIDRLITMLLLEYINGYADNDHALMQNTGVLEGYPIHIDVGQFIKNQIVKSPKIYKKELYDKTYKFHGWLKKHYPKLALHLEARLVAVIGPDYFYSAPYVHKGDVAKIPHID